MSLHTGNREALARAVPVESKALVQGVGRPEDKPKSPEIQGATAPASTSLVPPFTHAELREWLRYDPATGIWTNRICRGGGTSAGEIAGTVWAGYRRISIKGRLYKSSRLAFFYMTGAWLPSCLVMDHKNRVRDDDRWVNLRPATYQQNARNQSVSCRNRTGRIGVAVIKPGRWQAHITIGNRTLNLGDFDNLAEAIAVRTAAEREHFGAWAREAA